MPNFNDRELVPQKDSPEDTLEFIEEKNPTAEELTIPKDFPQSILDMFNSEDTDSQELILVSDDLPETLDSLDSGEMEDSEVGDFIFIEGMSSEDFPEEGTNDDLSEDSVEIPIEEADLETAPIRNEEAVKGLRNVIYQLGRLAVEVKMYRAREENEGYRPWVDSFDAVHDCLENAIRKLAGIKEQWSAVEVSKKSE